MVPQGPVFPHPSRPLLLLVLCGVRLVDCKCAKIQGELGVGRPRASLFLRCFCSSGKFLD